MLSTLNGEVCNTLNINNLSLDEMRKRVAGAEGSTAVIDNAAILYS